MPFSRFIPPGPGIHEIPCALKPTKISFISSDSLRIFVKMSRLPTAVESNMVNSL